MTSQPPSTYHRGQADRSDDALAVGGAVQERDGPTVAAALARMERRGPGGPQVAHVPAAVRRRRDEGRPCSSVPHRHTNPHKVLGLLLCFWGRSCNGRSLPRSAYTGPFARAATCTDRGVACRRRCTLYVVRCTSHVARQNRRGPPACSALLHVVARRTLRAFVRGSQRSPRSCRTSRAAARAAAAHAAARHPDRPQRRDWGMGLSGNGPKWEWA
jgi:hypothetical protein